MEETCRVIVNDLDCGKPAVAYITVNDRIVKADVPACAEHKAEHNRKAAQLRASTRKS